MEMRMSWTDFKSIVSSKSIKMQYYEGESSPIGTTYFLSAYDCAQGYMCRINDQDNPLDVSDFETNYKASANQEIVPHDDEGKNYVRAESRPLNCTTCFTSCGDISGDNPQIGAGPRMYWDASESEGWETENAPSGYKQFSTRVSFCDSVWLKEGTIYYMNAKKGSYCDMQVICPSGYYFLYQGQVAQSQSDDMVVDHYLFKHPMQGDVPMGDELNTESCSQELPSYLQFEFTATVPESDTDSYGYMEMELYRVRTVVI